MSRKDKHTEAQAKKSNHSIFDVEEQAEIRTQYSFQGSNKVRGERLE
jgi:hypothetical protein